MELHTRLRPKSLKEVAGQASAVRVLEGWAAADAVPRVVLFLGQTGVGKTTLARILARLVGTHPDSLVERDCAEDRGIDMARDVKDDLRGRPLAGEVTTVILDEVVQLPRQTQQALLKTLEEPPNWAYLFLTANVTAGLLPAFLGRCKVVQLQPVAASVVRGLLDRACKALNADAEIDVLDAVADACQGSVRQALGLLEAVLAVEGQKERLAVVGQGYADPAEVVHLCRLLLKAGPWGEVVRVLNDLPQNPESVRYAVLPYMNKVLDSGSVQAAKVIAHFQYSFAESGPAGLKLACFNVCRKG